VKQLRKRNTAKAIPRCGRRTRRANFTAPGGARRRTSGFQRVARATLVSYSHCGVIGITPQHL
jgi:hypothetical protein